MSLRAKMVYRLDDFSSGYKSLISDELITGFGVSDHPLTGAVNVTTEDASGMLVRRRGHELLVGNPTFSAINSMISARGLAAGAANQLLFGAGPNIYKYDVAAGLSVAIITGLTANKLLEGALAPQSGGQGPLYLLNGAEARYWTGAAAGTWTASAGTLPIGRFLLWHGTRMWVAAPTAASLPGVADPGSALCFSQLGDPRNWPAANVVSFDPNDGERISGIGKIGPYLVVFKPSKIWLIYDLDTGANRQLSSEVGCIGHRTIAETQKGLYFWTRNRGLAVTDGSNIKLVDDNIGARPKLDTSLMTNAAGYWPGEYNSVTSWNDRLYITYAFRTSFGVTGFDGIYEYVPRNDAWWSHPRGPSGGFGAMTDTVTWDAGDGTGDKLYTIALENTSYIFARLFNTNDPALQPSSTNDFPALNINPPRAEIFTRMVDFGTARRKQPRAINVEGRIRATSEWRGEYSALVAGKTLTYTVAGEQLYDFELPRPKSFSPETQFGLHLTSDNGTLPVDLNQREFVIKAITFYADPMSRGRVHK